LILRDTESAARHVRESLATNPDTKLIAIGGPTAVGKSTLAKTLRRELRESGISAYVFEGDRYLVPQKDRPHPATFPDQVYEINRFREAVRSLAEELTFTAPFYERDGRHTGRLTIDDPEDAEEILALCRARAASESSELQVADAEVREVIDPSEGVWILDSELALLYQDLRPLYGLSYGIRASRERRRAHFLNAVRKGERYPFLTELEAKAKIEGFWETDDALIEPTVRFADVQVEWESP